MRLGFIGTGNITAAMVEGLGGGAILSPRGALVAGHAGQEAAVKAAAADYLLKPVSMHDLAAVVARALAARAEQRQQRHVMDLMSQVVDALRASAEARGSGQTAGVPFEVGPELLDAAPLVADMLQVGAQVARDHAPPLRPCS